VNPPSDQLTVDQDGDVSPGDGRRRTLWVGLGVGVIAAAVVLAGIVLAGSQRPPSDDSAEAGFARDMQVHHAQAVEMAFLLRDRTRDPVMRIIALDIITTQQQQMGQMYGWLRMWGLPQSSPQPAMAWMAGASGHGAMSMGSTPPAGRMATANMPGMATREEMDALGESQGRAAETLFLQLMIRHHRGGIAMAESARGLASDPNVVLLADAIASSQAAEITQMEALLAERVTQSGP
jgi:uncharacterized protein (DUF305 family)